MRNLEFPLDWDGSLRITSAFLPSSSRSMAVDGKTSTTSIIPDEFFRAYDCSRDLCMLFQKAVKFNEYFRCYVVGQEKVRIMPYDPRRPHHERYLLDPGPASTIRSPARARRDETALTLYVKALGYDLNTVEFAVEDGSSLRDRFHEPRAPDADRCTR